MSADRRGEDTSFFEEKLGYAFHNPGIFREALTHASYANELGLPLFNERLEYLGDAVLELCVSEMLFVAHPDYTEGELTKARSLFVCERTLASWASRARLYELLLLGKGLERQGGRKNPSILADAVEAVFGAVFLDGGYEAARAVVARFVDSLRPGSGGEVRDPKSRLQELLQARGEKPPQYRLISRSGPDHATFFKVELISSSGNVLASGTGSSIKAAEFEAAETALLILACEEEPAEDVKS